MGKTVRNGIMRELIFCSFALLLLPFISTAPSEERSSIPPDGFLELYNSTLDEDQVQDVPENDSPQSEEPSKNLKQESPPPVTIPLFPPNIPLVFPRPFNIPLPFPFPPPSAPQQFPAFVQLLRPLYDVEPDEDKEDLEKLTFPEEILLEPEIKGRRAPISNKKKKQKKQTKQKKHKKQKKQKKQKNPQQQIPIFPQPIVIYQNQEEVGNENPQHPMASATGAPGAPGPQGAQTSYMGYYMVYVIEVRWTGNNFTQTGRPIPAAITIPPTTDQSVVNNLSETISPANLVNRPQPTPACFFRSTTTEHFGTSSEAFKPVETVDENNAGVSPDNQEEVGEETETEAEDSDEVDSVEDEYEDDSDPKRTKKKKRKGILQPLTSPEPQ